jgi:hypothetical protein
MVAPIEQAKTMDADYIKSMSVADDAAKSHNGVQLDKFGAAAKSNPAEIALVKKHRLNLFQVHS